ncbi:MAG TPA: flagellin, partial [Candidatus Acidoferrum sp.]|nr:flagellin [Candidatus Acidoferrum sp.]
YRAQLDQIQQCQKNVSQAQNWSGTYDSALSDAKGILDSAKEIAVAMADGTYDDTARAASANEVQSLFDRLIELGNTTLEGRHVFGGFKTQVTPFTVSTNGVTYNGDTGDIQYEIEPGSLASININGASAFLKQSAALGSTADLNVGITANTQLSELNNGRGIDMTAGTFTIFDRNRNLTVAIDLTGATTVGDAITAINTQLNTAGITDLTAQLGPDGNNFMFKTAQNSLVSTATQLIHLNNGTGVDLTPGKIRISNGAGIEMTVDLSGSASLGDVITKFNTQLAAAGVANVTMGLNGTGTGLAITDTNAIPLNLTISDVTDYEQTASSLGIVGTVSPTLTGTDLNPTVDYTISETTGTTAADLGITGEFFADYSARDIDPRLLATSLVTSLRNGVGIDRDSITLWQGGSTATINFADPALVTIQDVIDRINNSGLNITASINASGRGIQIVNNDTKKSFTVEDTGSGRTAKDLQLFGSNDTMGSMLVLANALRRNDQEGTGMLLRNLDDSIQRMLDSRATVGSRAVRFESANTRLNDMNLSFTKLLSETEDADMPSLVSTLATYENNYQAALQATAKIIQPSLLDFLK